MSGFSVAVPEAGGTSPSGPHGRRLYCKWVALAMFCLGFLNLSMAVLYGDERTDALGFAVIGIGSLAVGRVFLNRARAAPESDAPAESATAATARPSQDGRFLCPCCGCFTLGSAGSFEICPVCFWEDDGQDDGDAEVVRGGPNGRLSLSRARENYLRFGARDERFVSEVRAPYESERPGGGP